MHLLLNIMLTRPCTLRHRGQPNFTLCHTPPPYLLDKLFLDRAWGMTYIIKLDWPLCSPYPLAPIFYVVDMGYAEGYIIFLIFALKHRLWIRGSSNKEWDFFYGAVNLHARLMKYQTYLDCPFGSSRVTFLS